MYTVRIWGENTPTEEVEESVSMLLWGDVYLWFTGEEGTVFDARGRKALLDSLIRQQLDPDEDMVRSAWERVLGEVETTIAATVRRVVPDEEVRRWLERRLAARRPTDRGGVGACDVGNRGKPTAAACTADSDTSAQKVLEGLRLLTRAAAAPELAASLGITDHAPLAVWLKPALPQIDGCRTAVPALVS